MESFNLIRILVKKKTFRYFCTNCMLFGPIGDGDLCVLPVSWSARRMLDGNLQKCVFVVFFVYRIELKCQRDFDKVSIKFR